MAHTPDAYVSLDDATFQLFSDRFTLQELKQLAEATEEISENIVDVFDGMPVDDVLAAQGMDIQQLFVELEQVLPEYIDMVRASFDKVGDELYVEINDAAAMSLLHTAGECRFPKLLISDGSRGFAFLQIAAWKAGIRDDNLRFWYRLVNMFVLQHIAEQEGDRT